MERELRSTYTKVVWCGRWVGSLVALGGCHSLMSAAISLVSAAVSAAISVAAFCVETLQGSPLHGLVRRRESGWGLQGMEGMERNRGGLQGMEGPAGYGGYGE